MKWRCQDHDSSFEFELDLRWENVAFLSPFVILYGLFGIMSGKGNLHHSTRKHRNSFFHLSSRKQNFVDPTSARQTLSDRRKTFFSTLERGMHSFIFFFFFLFRIYIVFHKWISPSENVTSRYVRYLCGPSRSASRIIVHYENKPIQIYWKIYHQKNENFQKKKSDIFFIFLLKTYIVVLVRTASTRLF